MLSILHDKSLLNKDLNILKHCHFRVLTDHARVRSTEFLPSSVFALIYRVYRTKVFIYRFKARSVTRGALHRQNMLIYGNYLRYIYIVRILQNCKKFYLASEKYVSSIFFEGKNVLA